MVAVQVARIIANVAMFLEGTDDETLDLDTAIKGMEMLGADVARLDKDFLQEVVDSFATIAPEYEGEWEQFVRDIPSEYALDEALAADEPIKLAALDAKYPEEE